MFEQFWLDFENLLIKLIFLLFVMWRLKLCSFTKDIQTTLKTWSSIRTLLVKMYKIKCIFNQFITNLIWECSGRLKYQSKRNWITCVYMYSVHIFILYSMKTNLIYDYVLPWVDDDKGNSELNNSTWQIEYHLIKEDLVEYTYMMNSWYVDYSIYHSWFN